MMIFAASCQVQELPNNKIYNTYSILLVSNFFSGKLLTIYNAIPIHLRISENLSDLVSLK